MSPLPSLATAPPFQCKHVNVAAFHPYGRSVGAAPWFALNRERPHKIERRTSALARGHSRFNAQMILILGPRQTMKALRHRPVIRPRCSAASRVPEPALGGCAALDPACAPCV